MVQIPRLALQAALLGLLAAPATSTPIAPTAAQSPTALAHVDVLAGRAVLLGGGADAETIRRGQSIGARGRSQLEISTGSQVRVSWHGVASVHLWGPASLEWDSRDASLSLRFHELAWADVEARTGRHQLALPEDWHAEFGRSSFHLRGLSGGPSEVRHHAGDALVLDWRGDDTELRPPVAIYPGSSIRLDRPRYERTEVASRRTRGAWKDSETQDEMQTWPWRERADTDQQVAERVTLAGETQTFDEVPGDPKGQITRVRTFDSDDSSQVAPIRRRTPEQRTRAKNDTSAQVPVVPVRPRIEIEPRPLTPRTPERSEAPRATAPDAFTRPSRATERSTPASRGMEESRGFDAQPTRTRRMPDAPAPATGSGLDVDRRTSADAAERAARSVRARAYPFDALQWRGLDITDLNGTGEIAAERGSGVEVRVLGQGRAKVFVSSGAPGPRWCFTPTADLLMHPGSVAVFEADGTLRMSFGRIDENEPQAGRPSYGNLAD
ncbi:MAG: hypothetical protein AAGI22_11785 [Planctomycetota bacterium]